MQKDYEKRKDRERKAAARERRKEMEIKYQAQKLQEFWDDPKKTKFE